MIHIQKFVERVQAFDARQAKDFMMTMKEAKDLHADITKLLLALEQVKQTQPQPDQNLQVEIRGPDFF